jgi:lipopolysaccharide/colanic/teichoic acid biosynthesis glycosyltransferase
MRSYFLKRPIDLVVSAAGLVLLSPVLAVIAAGVRVDSKGPILFKQERVGLAQEPFEILKFRTMIDRDAEGIDQSMEQVVSEATDMRITRFGRILRSTSLDELPQLMNILKGDMSLVGPRPVIPEQLSALPPARRKRFEVRPGLTGLAQVRGRRSLDWMEQLAIDAEYVQKLSLRTDLRIIGKTVRVVFKRSGIYGGAGSNWRTYIGAAEKYDVEPGEISEELTRE